MNTRLAISLLLIIFTWLALPYSSACSCVGDTSPKRALQRSAAVFTGRLLSARALTPNHPNPELRDREVTFEVGGVWKGPVRNRIRIRTATESSMCGYDFEQGVVYLVYAYADRGHLQTDICTRTTPLRHAAKDLRAFGPPRKP